MRRGSMLCTIPAKMRDEMAQDPFYRKCCITGSSLNIEWHHALLFRGKRVNAIFCIVPLTKEIHRQEAKYKEQIDHVVWSRASEEEIRQFSKAENKALLLERLNKKFGILKI